jgi:ADP-ribosyl-[dinitrogen reductase] hydrolase
VSDSSPDYRQALAVAVDAARKAGAILRADFHRPGGPRGHGDHAEADDEAGRLICDLLRPLGWGLRCEDPRTLERGSDGRHVWLIDPNDGTSAYLKGRRGSAVSIAALRDGVPVLGVVYAFCYPDSGEGDLVAWAEGCPLTRNGKPMRIDLKESKLDEKANPPAIVFVSQDADRKPAANAECTRPARFIALPSIAYRLARVAVGDGLAAVSLSGPGDWDYGAGHALLRGAGGVLVDGSGEEVRYTPDGRSSVVCCFGGSPAVVKELCQRDWPNVLGGSANFTPPFCLLRPRPGRAVADPGMLARAQGCLLGQLAGDSLGGQVEFRDRDDIERKFPDGVRELRDGGTWHNLAGQPTDDSEMALMLARTLVHEGRYDRSRTLDAYLHWWPHAWDRGSNLSRALGSAGSGRTVEERLALVEENANRGESGQSNGSLMRISPLGIFGAGRPGEAAAWAREDSGLTHPHSTCRDACAAFVAAIAHAIAAGDGPEGAYRAAVEEAGRSGGQPAVRQALEMARLSPPADYQTHMGFVLVALQNAFWQLLHAASLEEGVVDTVMRGGDTDTNGAIAGALLGAVHGRDAVPSRWVSALLSCRPMKESGTRHPMPQEFWPVDALVVAEALLYTGQQ